MLSWAKLQISQFSININWSLIETLKSKGSNINPWGIPFFTLGQKLHEEPIFTSCFRPAKWSSNNLMLFFFAMIRSWGNQSNALGGSIRIVPVEPELSSSFCQICNNLNKTFWVECAFLNPHNSLFKNKSVYSPNWL